MHAVTIGKKKKEEMTSKENTEKYVEWCGRSKRKEEMQLCYMSKMIITERLSSHAHPLCSTSPEGV